MEDVKQVIVVRKDLNMRKGKLAAQVAHAAMSFLTRDLFLGETQVSDGEWVISLTPEQVAWCSGAFAKVVVYVNSEQELRDLINLAKGKGMVVHEIIDSGRTEFNGVPTLTCAAFGPHSISRFTGVTDKLPLL